MKKTLLLLSVLFLAIASEATVVNSSQAKAKAQAFLTEKSLSGHLSEVSNQKARMRDGNNTGDSYYYIFNIGDNNGYVIVSGDDTTPAVLGYATRGSIDIDRIPANMAAWLQGYADQIRYIQEHPVTLQDGIARVSRANHPAVSDLIKTEWDQGDPYNLLIEKDGNVHSATGCVTTAMAQIMYYYGHPSGTAKTIPGYTSDIKQIVCPDLPATTFEWSKMSTTYDASSSEESRMAVAKLMQYVSTALQADLSERQSNVWDYMQAYAMTTYFGYGKGVQLKKRDVYTDEDWDNLIYYELSHGRPVLYSGQADDGGHSFVVHGYDGNGFYTVNWGWSGDQDGKYLLDALTPTNGGIGSTDTSGHGYNFRQTALVGISPDNVDIYVVKEDVVLTTEHLAIADKSNVYQLDEDGQYDVTLDVKFINKLTSTYDFDYDFKILKDGQFCEYLFHEGGSLEGLPPLSFFPYDTFTRPKGHESEWTLYFPDGDGKSFKEPGTYKVIPVSRKTGETEWRENIGSDTYYLTGVVSEDHTLTLYVGDIPVPGQELAKAKEKLESTVTKFDEAITTLSGNNEKNSNKLAELKTSITTVSENINALTTKSGMIEELLKQLSAASSATEEIKAYQTQLDAINTRIGELKGMQDKLQEQISQVEVEIQNMDKTLADAKTLKEQALTTFNTSTEVQEVTQMTMQVINSHNDLVVNGVNHINVTVGNLNTINDNIGIINTYISNATTVADQLYQTVEKAVATGIDSLMGDGQEVLGRYDLQGRPVGKDSKGVRVIRLKNGKVMKTINK
jgi:chaperonin cofactor prefoldin